MQLKKIRKQSRNLHRDLGYFFFGMTLIYAISGLALNHMHDWDPSYIIEHRQYTNTRFAPDMTTEQVKQEIARMGIDKKVRRHYYRSTGVLKIFLDEGSLVVDLASKEALFEHIRRRPVFYELNLLHYNPGNGWKWFSDFFAVSWIFLAITGLLLNTSQKGIKGRGKWFLISGLILPAIFLFF